MSDRSNHIFCPSCKSRDNVVKNWFIKTSGKIRFRCKSCNFTYSSSKDNTYNKEQILKLIKNLGIRGCARALMVSPTTILNRRRAKLQQIREQDELRRQEIARQHNMWDPCGWAKSLPVVTPRFLESHMYNLEQLKRVVDTKINNSSTKATPVIREKAPNIPLWKPSTPGMLRDF